MLRFFFRLIFFAVFLILLLFIFAPNVISTKWGKPIFFKAYRAATGNTLTADTFEISWWKGQKFENISIKYPREKTTFTGQKIITDTTLWQLIFFHNLGNMEMTAPQVIIDADLSLPAQKKVSEAGFVPIFAPSKTMPSYLGHIAAKNGKAQFLSKGFDPIELQNVDFDASLLKTQIKLKSSGQTSQKNITGHFDLSLMYNHLQSQIDLMANLQNFPMRSIDQIAALFQPAFKGALLESVGEAINVRLRLRNLPQTLELFCDAASPSFSAHIETETQNGTVSLRAPALIQFQIPRSFVQKLTALPLQNVFQGQLKIDNLSLPLAHRENFSFQATLKGEALEFPFGTLQPFALFVSTTDFAKRNFTLKIDSPEMQLNTSLYLPDERQKLTFSGEGLFPNNTHIDFSAETLAAITVNVQGDKWQGRVAGGYDLQQNVIFLTNPADVIYHLKQLPAPLPPLLQQPLTLHGQVKPFRISLSQMTGQIAFQLRTDPTTLAGIALGETTLLGNADLKTRKGTFEIASILGKGKVDASGTFGLPQELTAKISLVQAPTAFLDLFLKDLQLTPIVGPEFNATVNLNHEQQLSFDLNSSAISAEASLEKTSTAIRLTKPAKLSFTLTPEGYLALDRSLNTTPTPFVLTQPASIKSTITSFSIPYKEKLMMSEITCQADLSINALAFTGKNSAKSTQLNHILLHLDHSATGSPFAFNLAAGGSPEGSINIQGKIDLTNGNLQMSSKLDQFPTEALDAVSRAIGQGSLSYAALFGPEVNITASSSLDHWNGPVKLELRSPNIRASLDGSLSEGLLTLKDSFHMQMSLTPDLSRLILNKLNPLSLSAIRSQAPITLEIPAQGFSYPISSNAKINIPSGRLELGKLYCHNEGNVNIALGLLKLSQFSQNESLELWLAPLDFHIKNGILDCERTEILIANTYQICCWGTIDFVARDVDMILGLTASSLKTAFGINNLPETYVLQIPMRGSLDKVKINTSKATAKIAALLLWQQKAVSQSLGKGTAGALLGEFMNKLGTLPDENSKAPPPKKPFPWDNAAPSSKKKKTAEAERHKKHFVPDEQALKQVLKMLH